MYKGNKFVASAARTKKIFFIIIYFFSAKKTYIKATLRYTQGETLQAAVVSLSNQLRERKKYSLLLFISSAQKRHV
jgi:hypothetical protein